jgi:hypothetical protein
VTSPSPPAVSLSPTAVGTRPSTISPTKLARPFQANSPWRPPGVSPTRRPGSPQENHPANDGLVYPRPPALDPVPRAHTNDQRLVERQESVIQPDAEEGEIQTRVPSLTSSNRSVGVDSSGSSSSHKPATRPSSSFKPPAPAVVPHVFVSLSPDETSDPLEQERRKQARAREQQQLILQRIHAARDEKKQQQQRHKKVRIGAHPSLAARIRHLAF